MLYQGVNLMGGTKPPKLKIEDEDKTYIQRWAPFLHEPGHCCKIRVHNLANLISHSCYLLVLDFTMQALSDDAGQYRSSGDQHSRSHRGLKGPIGERASAWPDLTSLLKPTWQRASAVQVPCTLSAYMKQPLQLICKDS